MSEQSESTPQLNPYSLSGLALARFRETFGEPTMSIGHDHQWSLKTAPFGHDIHVLVDGQEHRPIVWIFDPNDRSDGVSRSLIEEEESIATIVDHVRDRVRKAAQITRKIRESRAE